MEPLDLQDARKLALKEVERIEKNINGKLTLLDNDTIEFIYGWVFFYQTTEYINTGMPGTRVGGNAPIIIDKRNAAIHITGTEKDIEFYINEYIDGNV